MQKYNDFRSIWNHNKVKEKLNRCHIVPDSLGGEDEPCNLFLLCSECHDKAPDTDEPKHFIRYIYNTRHNRFFGVNAQEIRQMLISSIMLRFPNADEKDMESLFNKLLLKFNKDNFEEYCLKHSTLHWSDTGPHYAISTAVEMFIDFLLTYERDVCELVINKKSIKQK